MNSPSPQSNEPGSKTSASQKSTFAVIRDLLPFLKPYKTKAYLAIAFLLIAAGATLVTPVFLRSVVDQGFAPAMQNKDLSSFTQTLYWLAGVGCVMAIAAGARFSLVSWIGERVVSDMRSQVFGSLLKQPPAFFETLSSGEVLSRLTADTTLIQTIVGSSLSLGLRNFLLLVGSVVMLFVTNATISALVLGMIGVVMLIILLFTRRVRKLSRASQDRVADVSSHAGEVLNAMTTVQANVQENYERDRFNARVEAAFETGMRRTRIRAIAMVVIMIAFAVALLYGVWLGGKFVIEGKATLGELSQFAVYALMVASSGGALAEVWGELQRAAGASERLLELLNTQPSIRDSDQAAKRSAQSLAVVQSNARQSVGIEFIDLSFTYPTRLERPILRKFHLQIKAGQRIALVGSSGAGKSTLFSLLQRFYEVDRGQISLTVHGANIPIEQFRLADLRNQMSVVSQEPVIFSASALENIRYGNQTATQEDVIAAAKTAAIHDFIQTLPEGYDTFLGEKGVRLSGGQRQRLAIARAILRNAPILLLDEATSALDAQNEQLVQDALEKAMLGRTCLVIAHRLSTIKDCDLIHVMSEGQIIESGTHDELLAAGQHYARLVELQGLH